MRKATTDRVLTLPLKTEYFNQIRAGIKPFEFRRCTAYWRKRLVNRDYDRIVLTLGYPSRGDTARRLQRPWRGLEIQTITHPLFGEQPVEVFAILVN